VSQNILVFDKKKREKKTGEKTAIPLYLSAALRSSWRASIFLVACSSFSATSVLSFSNLTSLVFISLIFFRSFPCSTDSFSPLWAGQKNNIHQPVFDFNQIKNPFGKLTLNIQSLESLLLLCQLGFLLLQQTITKNQQPSKPLFSFLVSESSFLPLKFSLCCPQPLGQLFLLLEELLGLLISVKVSCCGTCLLELLDLCLLGPEFFSQLPILLR